MNVAYVICDHGFGHLRRCYLNALHHINSGAEVTLYTSLQDLSRLQPSLPHASLSVYHLCTNTTPSLFLQPLNNILSWLENLPSLSHHDVIISDNLPEILSLYPRAEISAQFFWHDVLPKINSHYTSLCEELLKQHQPIIKGDPLFSTPAVIKQANYIPQQLPANPLLKSKPALESNKQSILISGGSTSLATALFSSLLLDIIATAPHLVPLLIVDQNILSSVSQKLPVSTIMSLEVATYRPSMFDRISLAFCRPGLGIISDLLATNVNIVPVVESNNKELNHNATVVNALSTELRIDLLKHHSILSIFHKYAFNRGD